jgi:hypothetical protein
MGAAVSTFGPFVFDRAKMKLTRDGRSVSLGGRGAALLAALLDEGGGVVGKDALMQAAWPGAVVEEANLTVQIAALRRALGGGEDGEDWIVTVPRVGYRLLWPRAGGSIAMGAALDRPGKRLRVQPPLPCLQPGAPRPHRGGKGGDERRPRAPT